MQGQARALDLRLQNIVVTLTGDPVIAAHSEPTPPAIADRVQNVVGAPWTPGRLPSWQPE